jgi:hypothetical protein
MSTKDAILGSMVGRFVGRMLGTGTFCICLFLKVNNIMFCTCGCCKDKLQYEQNSENASYRFL